MSSSRVVETILVVSTSSQITSDPQVLSCNSMSNLYIIHLSLLSHTYVSFTSIFMRSHNIMKCVYSLSSQTTNIYMVHFKYTDFTHLGPKTVLLVSAILSRLYDNCTDFHILDYPYHKYCICFGSNNMLSLPPWALPITVIQAHY